MGLYSYTNSSMVPTAKKFIVKIDLLQVVKIITPNYSIMAYVGFLNYAWESMDCDWKMQIFDIIQKFNITTDYMVFNIFIELYKVNLIE